MGFVGHDAACRFFRVEPIKLPSQPGELITFILRPGCVRVFASAFTPKQYPQWKSNDTSDIISSHPAFSHLFSIKYHHSKIPTIYVNNLIQHTASSAPFWLVAFPCCQLVGTQHSSRFSQSFQSCLSLCLDTAQAAASIDGTSPLPFIALFYVPENSSTFWESL